MDHDENGSGRQELSPPPKMTPETTKKIERQESPTKNLDVRNSPKMNKTLPIEAEKKNADNEDDMAATVEDKLLKRKRKDNSELKES